MNTAADADAWKEVGRRLAEAREALRPKLSKREAAKRAEVSEVFYRQLEAGEKQIARGMKVPVSPKDENLEAAALAVGLDPKPLFELVGRDYRPSGKPAPRRGFSPEALEDRMDRRFERVEQHLERIARHLGLPDA